MASEAVKLERERRKTMHAEKAWAVAEKLAGQAAILEPAAIATTMLLTYKAGKERWISRDMAGAIFATEGVLAAARYGVHDRWALGALWSALVGAYAVSVRPTESEAIVTLEPWPATGWEGGFWSDVSNVLFGSDQKFFNIPLPWAR